jgi:hypothetical protein
MDGRSARGHRRPAGLTGAVIFAVTAMLTFGAATASAGTYLGSAEELGTAPPLTGGTYETSSHGADSRIVGGGTTTIEQYPWQVALTMNPAVFAGTAMQRQTCGATAIAPTLLVSAAHCVHDPNQGGFQAASNYAAVSGRTTLTTTSGRETTVKDYYFFINDNGTPGNPADDTPRYSPTTMEYDVVLIELSSASAAVPVKIAGPDETALWSPGRTAFISGWGHTSEGGQGSDTLKAAQIGMLDDASCAGVYDGSANAGGSRYVPESMVCAGVMAGGVDTCQGDSGGPLVVPTSAGEYRLVGDVSFGRGCARVGFPGVYGRVAADPIRSGLAQISQSLAGVNVVGSGGQPPAPPAPPVVDPPPPTVDADCVKAQAKFKKAKKKFKKAKNKLASALQSGSEKKYNKAKKKFKKAKNKKKKAKKKVQANC